MNANSEVSKISISESTINATGGYLAAGIGSGYANNGSSRVGSIHISGSTITSLGMQSGGVGSGHGSGGISSVALLRIENTNLSSSGATGVGSGTSNEKGESTVGRLMIENSTVFARGGAGGAWDNVGAGIGSALVYTLGSSDSNGRYSSVDSILIENSTIDGTGGEDCAGIGSGFGRVGTSIVSNITIRKSIVTARGSGDASGIGCGRYSFVSRITIDNSRVLAGGGWSSSPALGSPISSRLLDSAILSDSVIILNGPLVISDDSSTGLFLVGEISLTCFLENLACVSASRITFQNSSIQGRVSDRLFSETGNMIGSTDLVILYSVEQAARVEPEAPSFGKVIHLAHLDLPTSDNDTLTLFLPNASSFVHPISFAVSTVVSIALSIPNVSEWSVPVSYGSSFGFLCPIPNADQPFIPVDEIWTIVPTAYFVEWPWPTFTSSAAFSVSNVFPISWSYSPSSHFHFSVDLLSVAFLSTAASVLPIVPFSDLIPESPIDSLSSLFDCSSDPFSHPFVDSKIFCELSPETLSSPFVISPTRAFSSAVSSSSDGAFLVGAIAGIAAVLLVIVLGVVIAIFKRRRFRDKVPSPSGGSETIPDTVFLAHVLASGTGDGFLQDTEFYDGEPSELPSRQFEVNQRDEHGTSTLVFQSLLHD
jgi:hypothetical protein